MAIDFGSMLSTEIIDIPSDTIRREVEYRPTPFDKLIKDGPTPEGKGYLMTVSPADRKAGSEFRKELAGTLSRVERHANKPQRFGGWKVNDTDSDLRFSVGLTGSGLILTVERKRKTGPRKKGTPTESEKSGSPNIRKPAK